MSLGSFTESRLPWFHALLACVFAVIACCTRVTFPRPLARATAPDAPSYQRDTSGTCLIIHRRQCVLFIYCGNWKGDSSGTCLIVCALAPRSDDMGFHEIHK